MRSGPCANTCSAGEREILAYVLVDWDCAAAAPVAATDGALAGDAGSAVLLGGVVAPRRRELVLSWLSSAAASLRAHPVHLIDGDAAALV